MLNQQIPKTGIRLPAYEYLYQTFHLTSERRVWYCGVHPYCQRKQNAPLTITGCQKIILMDESSCRLSSEAMMNPITAPATLRRRLATGANQVQRESVSLDISRRR